MQWTYIFFYRWTSASAAFISYGATVVERIQNLPSSGILSVIIILKLQKVQLFQRDNTMLYASWNLVKCCTTLWKITFEKPSECPERLLNVITNSAIWQGICHILLAICTNKSTMSLSCTVADILPLLQCTSLPLAMRSPLWQLKLYATYAYWFVW